MPSRRTLRKTLCTIIFILSSYAVYLAGYLILTVLKQPTVKWTNRYMHFWARHMCRILNLSVSISGTPPKPPFFLVCNHLSYVDIIPLYLHLNCTFVAKREVRNWPVLGFMIRTMGVLFIDRDRPRDIVRLNTHLASSMNQHRGVILFPEGTTSGGKSIQPFRPSLLEWPARTGQPVHFCAIRYQTAEDEGDPPAEENVCFYGARESFQRHFLKLASTRRIHCTLVFGAEPIRSNDRKQLARKLGSAVSEQFRPMISQNEISRYP